MPPAATPETPETLDAPPALGRRRRAGAVLFDLAVGVAFAAAAGLLAFGWLFLRTDGGARDAGSGDAALAFAVALAATPAWLGLLAASLIERNATPGQRRAGLVVVGSPVARLGRLALHPLGAGAWGWLAVVAAMAVLPVLPLLLAAAGAIVGTMAVITLAALVARPDWTPLHDRIAGTRLVRR